MPLYSIFGDAAQTGFTVGVATAEVSCSTAFHLTGVSGFRALGIKVWIPATTVIGATGHIGHLWTGAGNTPDTLVASVTFSNMLAGQWNSALFTTPVALTAGKFYWAQVYFPAGRSGFKASFFGAGTYYQSEIFANLYASGWAQINTAQGAFDLGPSGTTPNGTPGGSGSSWHGVDVLIDDGTWVTGPGSSDPTGIRDSVSISRTGLPSTVVADGTATDPMGAVGSDSSSLPVGGATGVHTIRRGFFDVTISWGWAGNHGPRGPSFQSLTPRSLGVEFTVLRACRFVACRIYKAPNLAGTIPITLWSFDGLVGTDRGTETVSWVADAGGWREIEFATPIELVPDTIYKLAYLCANGVHAGTTAVFVEAVDWPHITYPMRVAAYSDPAYNTTGIPSGGSCYHVGTAHLPPEFHTSWNYYVEPVVEWEEDHPVFVPDKERSYYNQWVNGMPSKPFHFSVFFADPEFLVEYAAMGVTTLVAGGAHAGYVAAVKAANMDEYVGIGQYPDTDRTALVEAMAALGEDPEYAAHVKGFVLDDEADLTPPYRPPTLTMQWMQEAKLIDNTRPTVLGMSYVVGLNNDFVHMPQGSSMDTANDLWRQWARIPDIQQGDFYTLGAVPLNFGGNFGVWMYAKFTERLRMLGEGRVPVWNIVETTSQRPGYPVPADVVKACWASLISGAQGIVFFDHRFGDQYVTMDFAAMLHDPPMKAAVSAMIVRCNAIADALHSPEANLCTAHTSSNVTSGPMGGTYGVPMHYTTRDDGTKQYLFAMGIRPGATTATFTLPSWAGETVTVLDESRTVVVDGSGVLEDEFPADYTVHLYERTP